MTDDLARRMRNADPAQLLDPTDKARMQRVQTLTEDIMSEAPVDAQKKGVPRAWIGAAAAVVLVVALGAFALLRDSDSGGDTLRLAVAIDQGGVAMGSCIAFSPEMLTPMEVAFDGTVTEIGDGTVTLDVSHWYKGGDADAVELSVPSGDSASTVSIDGVQFEQGGRYLVSASDGTVTSCGFSGPWSAELEQGFKDAFGG